MGSIFDTASKKVLDFLGMTSLGQKTKANSLSTTFASDQFGQATMANSLPVVISSDQSPISTGATDDAAAAGQIYVAGGVYQSTVDEVDNGDAGRVRISVQRAVINTPDYGIVECYNSGGTSGATDGDIRDVTARNFNFLNKPLAAYASTRSFFIYNGLNVSVTLRLVAWQVGPFVAGTDIWSEVIPTATTWALLPYAGGTGASATVKVIPALACLTGNQLRIIATASPTPTSGTLTIHCVWGS